MHEPLSTKHILFSVFLVTRRDQALVQTCWQDPLNQALQAILWNQSTVLSRVIMYTRQTESVTWQKCNFLLIDRQLTMESAQVWAWIFPYFLATFKSLHKPHNRRQAARNAITLVCKRTRPTPECSQANNPPLSFSASTPCMAKRFFVCSCVYVFCMGVWGLSRVLARNKKLGA